MSEEFSRFVEFCRESLRLDGSVAERGPEGFCRGMADESREAYEALVSKDMGHFREEMGDIIYDWIHASLLAGIDIGEMLGTAIAKFNKRKPFVAEGRKVAADEAKRLWSKAKQE